MRRGEGLADLVECLEVRHGVGAARSADRRLVDEHDVVDPARPGKFPERGGRKGLVAEPAPERGIERLLDERALARAAHARHHAEDPERERDVEMSLRLCPPRRPAGSASGRCVAAAREWRRVAGR